MAFPIVMYGCDSWTIKKAKHWRIDAFELWCWRRLLRVPWTARRSNQSILKKMSPEYSLEGLMLKLKLQYFGHLMWRVDSLEKTLMLGKIEGRMKRGQQRMRWLEGINKHEFEWTPGVCDVQGSLAWCSPWGHKESDTTEQLNWTELKYYISFINVSCGTHTTHILHIVYHLLYNALKYFYCSFFTDESQWGLMACPRRIASKQWGRDVNSGSLALEPLLLPPCSPSSLIPVLWYMSTCFPDIWIYFIFSTLVARSLRISRICLSLYLLHIVLSWLLWWSEAFNWISTLQILKIRITLLTNEVWLQMLMWKAELFWSKLNNLSQVNELAY